MTTLNEAYIGSGIVYIAGRDVGNCSNVNFSIEQETKTQRNYRGGGGNAASVTNVTAVKLSMELNNFSNKNLALALRGLIETITADAVSNESVTAVHDGMAATAFMLDKDLTVTVTDNTDVTTYTVGTDYEVTPAGIKALSTGTITDGQELHVSYTKKAGNVLQALVDSGVDVPVVLDGINDSSGKPYVVKVHRWKPSPTSGLGLISDDFSSFSIEGEVLADESIVAAGKSKFFQRAAA